jgi:hypothetical protein
MEPSETKRHSVGCVSDPGHEESFCSCKLSVAISTSRCWGLGGMTQAGLVETPCCEWPAGPTLLSGEVNLRMVVLMWFTCDVARAARYPVQAVCDACHHWRAGTH